MSGGQFSCRLVWTIVVEAGCWVLCLLLEHIEFFISNEVAKGCYGEECFEALF